MRAPSTESRGRINVLITCGRAYGKVALERRRSNKDKRKKNWHSHQFQVQQVQRCSRSVWSTGFYHPTSSEKVHQSDLVFNVVSFKSHSYYFTSLLKTVIAKPLTLVRVLVIRDWMLLVVVLNVLQLCAIRRAAKSRKAQWLSTSGLKHSCLLTMHVTTAGMSSCSYKHRSRGKASGFSDSLDIILLEIWIWFHFPLTYFSKYSVGLSIRALTIRIR